MQANCTTSGPHCTVSLSGKLDYHSTLKFHKATLAPLKDPAVKTISINLQNLDYLDSSGLVALLVLREKAMPTDKKLELVSAHGDVKRALDLSNFKRLLPIS